MMNLRLPAFLVTGGYVAVLLNGLDGTPLLILGAIALLWFPGVLAAANLRVDPEWRGLTAAVLSPLVAGLLLALALVLGLDARTTVRALVIASGVGYLLLPRRAPRDAVDAWEPQGTGSGPWLVGLGFAALVGALAVANPGRLLASDAWFHVAVVQELDRAGLPLQDPYFAGLPLQYFWFYHVVALAFVHASGLAPQVVLAGLAAWGACLAVPAAAAVARALGASRGAGVWAGVVLLLGMGGMYGVFLPLKLARAFTGDVRGADAFAEIFRLTPFQVITAEAFVQVHHSSSFFLRKFFVATAVPWSLVSGLTAVHLALRFVRGGGAGQLGALVLAAAGSVLFHVILGGGWMAALLAAAGLAAALRRSGRAAAVAAAAAAGVAACWPYLHAVTQAKDSGSLLPVGFAVHAVAGLAITLAGVFLLGWPRWRALAREGRAETTLFVAFGAVCVAGAVFARLPGPNQFDKPPIIAHLPLALAAGMAIPWWWSRLEGRRVLRPLFSAALFLFLVPENTLVAAAYFRDPGRTAPTDAEREAYTWIGEHTQRDAVFLDSDDRTDILVHGPRRQVWGLAAYADQWGYDPEEMAARRAVRDAVFQGQSLDAPARARLAALEAPVYAIVRESDAPGVGARLAGRRGYRQVHTVPGIRVFRLDTR